MMELLEKRWMDLTATEPSQPSEDAGKDLKRLEKPFIRHWICGLDTYRTNLIYNHRAISNMKPNIDPITKFPNKPISRPDG